MPVLVPCTLVCDKCSTQAVGEIQLRGVNGYSDYFGANLVKPTDWKVKKSWLSESILCPGCTKK